MARRFNGAGDQLWLPVAAVAGYPVTLAVWARATGASGTMIALSNPSTNSDYIGIVTDVAGSTVRARANTGYSSSGAFNNFSAAASSSLGEWFHAALVISSATQRWVYHNGQATAGNGASVPAAAWNRTALGNAIRLAATSYFAGDLAHAAVWASALSPREVGALASGCPPTLVRPGELAEYWALEGLNRREEPGMVAGKTLAAEGTTWASGPPWPSASSNLHLNLEEARPSPWHDGTPAGWTPASSSARRPVRWYPGLSRRRRRA